MQNGIFPQRFRRLLGALAALAASPAIANTDLAASAATADAGAANSPQELSEVVVYARRRTESIQDSPLAVSVRSGEELREQSADLVGDVGRDIPNVYMFSSPQSVSALNITMRGQTVSRSAIAFDSAVGVYVDGVYVADAQGAMSTLLDVQSVEVVRGSQGTLFGRNNTGGAVLFYTHRPDLTADSAELAVSGGDYREFMGRAIVNIPLSSTFGLRFAYQDNSRAGFGWSEGSGQSNLQNQHRYSARGSALWKPADGTEAYFTFEHFEANEHGAILHPLLGPPPGTLISQLGQLLSGSGVAGLPRVQFPSDPFVADGGYPGFDDAKIDALQLTITQQLTEENIAKLILGYRHLDASAALDVDASPVPFADTLLINTSNQKSAELQLTGTYTKLRFDWVGGLYWFQDNGGAPSQRQPASPDFLGKLAQVDAMTGLTLTDDFAPVITYDQNNVVNVSEAAYVHSEGHITRDWALAAGARYTHDKREIQDNGYQILPGFGASCQLPINGAPINGPCPDINKVAGFDYGSWEISTHYRLSDGWNTYARIGRSYRSGGWNVPLGSYNDVPYRPEQITDYEIGAKANLFGSSLMLAADVFFGQYDDMQRLLGVLNSHNSPDTLVTNAGRARVSGTEFEGRWRMNSGMTVNASFGWTDGHYQSFLYTPVPGQPPVNLAGNGFSETPPFQASFGAQYEYPLSVGRLRLSADYAWQAKVQFNVINDFNYQPAYGTLNGRVALSGGKLGWEVALYGTNLTDQRFAYNGGTITLPPSPAAIFAWRIPGAPRMVAVEALYRWSMKR